MKLKTKRKPYWEMTTAELRRATRQFDRPMPGTPGKALTARDRKLHAQADRKPRPRGNGSAAISLKIDRTLLAKADAYAEAHNLSRGVLFEKGLRAVIGMRKKAG